MLNFKKEDDEIPLLYFLFDNNKINELIRLMLNRKMSEQYLLKYGEPPQFILKKFEQAKLQDYVKRLDVSEIVHLKGSQRNQVKYFCNTFLQEYFRRKLKRNCKFDKTDRKIVWVQVTQIFQLQNIYQGLQQLQLPHQIINMIAKDVHRSYISPQINQNIDLSAKTIKQEKMRGQLTETLQAFALYNPYIGYCQGMNTVFLFFLEEGFSQQQTFFIFKRISEELLPCDYYSSMGSTIAYVRILWELLHHTHPSAVKRMKIIMRSIESQGFLITLSFAFQWFICLFTNTNLDRSIRLIIMDHFLLDGIIVFFKVALAYFDIIQPAIAKVSSMQEYIPTVEKIIQQFKDEQKLRYRLNNIYINRKILNLLKDKLTEKQGDKRQRQQKSSCDRRWNTCLQVIQNNLSQGNSLDYFVFRTNEDLKFIDNYLQKLNKQYFRMCKIEKKSDQLRIGRMVHVCRSTSLSSKTKDEISDRNKYSSSGYSYSASKSQESPNKCSEITKKEEQEPRREMIRSKAMQNLEMSYEGVRKSVFNRSESVQFMRNMIQNESFSNLLQILEVQEMETLFKDDISQDD